LSTLTDVDRQDGPEFVTRYNQFQAVANQRSGRSRVIARDRQIAALEDVFKETMPPQMGYDYTGMTYQEV